MSGETGFPSPAQGYEAKAISLDSLLIKNRAATYMMRVTGSDMAVEGIHDGDILVIDRSRKVFSGSLIVFRIDAEFLCRRFLKFGDDGLVFSDGLGGTVTFSEEIEFFGPVTAVIRTFL